MAPDTGHKLDEAPGSLLCIGAFPSNVGFAWDFIETIYAGVADRLAGDGIATWVSYPSLRGRPRTLAGSSAKEVELRVDFGSPRSVRSLIQFIRNRDVRVMYMADQPTWHPAYAFLRSAGVRWIVVHAHSSGARTGRKGIAHALKRLSRSVPGTLVDRVIAVSDFVARRTLAVDPTLRERVVRIWNGVQVPADPSAGVDEFHTRFGLPRDRPLVVCAARAVREKGIHHLLRSFDLALRPGDLDPPPVLVYMGTGSYWDTLESLRKTLSSREDIRLLGYVEGASRFLGAAAVCVVPSIWQEAFGLAALEPMAYGVPVVASAVGGIPEVVLDGQTGRLVPPGNEEALANVLRELLMAPEQRRELGRRGRRRALDTFPLDGGLDAVYRVVAEGFLSQGVPS